MRAKRKQQARQRCDESNANGRGSRQHKACTCIMWLEMACPGASVAQLLSGTGKPTHTVVRFPSVCACLCIRYRDMCGEAVSRTCSLPYVKAHHEKDGDREEGLQRLWSRHTDPKTLHPKTDLAPQRPLCKMYIIPHTPCLSQPRPTQYLTSLLTQK